MAIPFQEVQEEEATQSQVVQAVEEAVLPFLCFQVEGEAEARVLELRLVEEAASYNLTSMAGLVEVVKLLLQTYLLEEGVEAVDLKHLVALEEEEVILEHQEVWAGEALIHYYQ